MHIQKIPILPPQKGLEFPVRPKILKKCVKLYWNFQRGGGGGLKKKSLPWGRYGYFLELHINVFSRIASGFQWQAKLFKLTGNFFIRKPFHLALVVQRLDNAIQRINRYPVDKC